MTISNTEFMNRAFDAGLDIALIGIENMSCKMNDYIQMHEIQEFVNLKNTCQKQLFIALNDFYFETQIPDLRIILTKIKELDIDGIIFHDLAVLVIAKELELKCRMLYHPETLNTHEKLSSFWQSKGVDAMFIAKEMSIIEQLIIARNATIETAIQVFGRQYMFHSRRKLVSNYASFVHEDLNKAAFLPVYEKLSDTHVLVTEEKSGTHIFTDALLMTIKEMDIIKDSKVNYLYLESLGCKDEELLDAIKLYHKVLTNDFTPNELIDLECEFQMNNSQNNYFKGFLFDETVYTIEDARKREYNESTNINDN